VKELESRASGFIGIGRLRRCKGALEGASMMPGGTKMRLRRDRGLVRRWACPGGRWPCVTYIGPGALGTCPKTGATTASKYGIEQIPLARPY